MSNNGIETSPSSTIPPDNQEKIRKLEEAMKACGEAISETMEPLEDFSKTLHRLMKKEERRNTLSERQIQKTLRLRGK